MNLPVPFLSTEAFSILPLPVVAVSLLGSPWGSEIQHSISDAAVPSPSGFVPLILMDPED